MNNSLKYFDKFTFFIMIAIAVTGIFLIYSASHTENTQSHTRQLLWLVVSIVGFIFAFKLKTEFILRYGTAIYILLIVILLLQLIAGKIVAGTKSWLKFGFFSIQVSEFIKIPLAVIVAKYLAKIDRINWKEFIRLSVMIGIPFVLIALQPDMGTAFILISVFITSVILKGIRPFIVFFLIITAILGSVMLWTFVLKPYQKDRITSFLNPEKYQKSSGYQIIQSKIAIGAGGIKGKGYMKGSQSKYKFLPTRHTDFIVSVLGEEFGFIGISFFLIIYFLFFYRQFYFITESEEELYIVYILLGIILFQFLINIMMSIGIIPILGLPLPFVSYGGSSLLGFFVIEGIIFKIRINSYLNEF